MTSKVIWCVVLALVLALADRAPAAPADLRWNSRQNQVSADIRDLSLSVLLKRVAANTGWTIYVEPETQHTVSTKFEKLTQSEALRRLLGDLNFALVPGTNGHSKLFVFRTAMKNATELVPGANRLIPNELVIKLKPGVKIEDVAKLLGGKATGSIDSLNLHRLEFADENAAEAAREQLAKLTEVASVENNYSVDRVPTVKQAARGDMPPLSLQMKSPPEGGRIIVGLVDTAVQPTGDALDAFVLKQISVAGPASLDPNTPSHGTTMRDTILRSLEAASRGKTSVQVLPIDVYGSHPSTSTFDVANGIVQAVNNGARIVNLSLGSEADTPYLRDVVRTANANNVLILAAAGNEPVTTPFFPAAYEEVMAVTAVDHGEIAPYANRGSFVALGAPGTSVIYFKDQMYYAVGTSSASAFTAGLAAGYMEAAGNDPAKVKAFLRSTYGLK